MFKENVLQPMSETNEPLEQTLYNRFKPEYMKRLDAMATRFPHVYRDLKTALKGTNLGIDVKFEYVLMFWTFCDIDPREFLNCFKEEK